jgi:hypothetical protein
MDKGECDFLVDELVSRKDGPALERILLQTINADLYWRSKGVNGVFLNAAKLAAKELALIAEGGLVALIAYPRRARLFGALSKCPRN